jgi:hypothetical protein
MPTPPPTAYAPIHLILEYPPDPPIHVPYSTSSTLYIHPDLLFFLSRWIGWIRRIVMDRGCTIREFPPWILPCDGSRNEEMTHETTVC